LKDAQPVGGATLIDAKAVMARAVRLGQLSMGLAKELTWWTGYDPLTTTPEIQEYLAAIRDAKAAIERARNALRKAFRRPKGRSAWEAR
jgi:hypothetical protein